MLDWLKPKKARTAPSDHKSIDLAGEQAPQRLLVFAERRAESGLGRRSKDALAGFPDGEVVDFEALGWTSFVNHDGGPLTLPVLVVNAPGGVTPADLDRLRLIKFLNYRHISVVIDGLDEIGFDLDHFELMSEEIKEAAQASSLIIKSFTGAPIGPRNTQIPTGVGRGVISFPPVMERSRDTRIVVSQAVAAQDSWVVNGRITTGSITAGDVLLSSPSNASALVSGTVDGPHASAISLEFREPFFPETGEVLSLENDAPVLSPVLCVRTLWNGTAIAPGDNLTVQFWFGDVSMKVEICSRIAEAGLNLSSTVSFSDVRDGKDGAFFELVLRADQLLPIDSFERSNDCGLVTLKMGDGSQSDGIVVTNGYADQRRFLSNKAENLTPVLHAVALGEREERNRHKGGVLWFTGLSGAGKSTLAVALEKRLFDLGFQVFVLDGDNVRQGLTANLGFSPDDRAENIRRVGEVAALFREAGVIVISSFISPYRSDRDRARHAAFPDFHEIYIEADVKTCIARDPKGLYKRALKGDLRDFTGISAPYEPPVAPELRINTEEFALEPCLDRLVNYVETHFRL